MPFNAFNISTAAGVIEQTAENINEVSANEEGIYTTWINLATKDIAQSFPNAPFLYASADRTLSSSVRLYTNFPSDFEKIIDVVYPTGDVKLKYFTEEAFDAIQPSAGEAGTPTIYTIHGNVITANSQIEFYPMPGSALTVNYQYRSLLTNVSAVSADIPIPIKYIDLYPLYVQFKALRRREDYNQAEIIEQKYNTEKQKMIDDFKRVTEEPWSIRSIREFTPSDRRYSNEIVDLFWGDNII